ncbi:MAG: RecX family transcriptional regulator [Bacteroidaceae bacterium]|nr:RecX family transcriptional regulator [Bacteroidaceae bacterium]
MKKEITVDAAYLRLSSKCAQAEHCAYDLQKIMKRWSMPEKQQDEIIKRLIKENFLNEERYAHAFVKDKFRYNKWGASRIRQELRMRNINENIIEDALTEISDDEVIESLKKLVRQKRQTIKAKSDYELRGKLIRFAMSRGFSYSTISKVIDTNDIEDNEDY